MGYLEQVKKSEDLNGLDKIVLNCAYDTPDADGFMEIAACYRSRTDTAIVDWLHGRTSEFPLEESWERS